MIAVGGGDTSDGLKERINGRKLYKSVVHNFEITKRSPLLGEAIIKYRSRMLFLEEHEGQESASVLRTLFNAWLMCDYGVSPGEVFGEFHIRDRLREHYALGCRALGVLFMRPILRGMSQLYRIPTQYSYEEDNEA